MYLYIVGKFYTKFIYTSFTNKKKNKPLAFLFFPVLRREQIIFSPDYVGILYLYCNVLYAKYLINTQKDKNIGQFG